MELYVLRPVGLFFCKQDYGKRTGPIFLMKLDEKGEAWAKGLGSRIIFTFAV